MQDFAAIDFETANGCRTSVCSVGVVVVRNGVVTDRFYSLIKPEPNYYAWFCQKVHGLCHEDTDGAEVFPEVWAKVAPMIEGLPLVAHNKQFDEGCLRAVMEVYQMDWPGYEFHCTLQASRRKLRGLEDYQLHTVSAACGYCLENHHHALADAEACAAIAIRLEMCQ
jgi:DNA polymerase-3 subunit epsilon